VIAFALAALTHDGIATAQEQETVKDTYGDWEVRCATQDPSICVMSQVGKTADGRAVLEARIRKLKDVKTKDGKTVPAAIQITTPLGAVLRAGVRLQIDASEPRTGMFEVCIPTGCVVRDALSEELLGRLKAGSVAKFTFGLIQQGETNTTLSLKGFTKAFDAL